MAREGVPKGKGCARHILFYLSVMALLLVNILQRSPEFIKVAYYNPRVCGAGNITLSALEHFRAYYNLRVDDTGPSRQGRKESVLISILSQVARGQHRHRMCGVIDNTFVLLLVGVYGDLQLRLAERLQCFCCRDIPCFVVKYPDSFSTSSGPRDYNPRVCGAGPLYQQGVRETAEPTTTPACAARGLSTSQGVREIAEPTTTPVCAARGQGGRQRRQLRKKALYQGVRANGVRAGV